MEVVGSKWIYKIKLKSDGSTKHFKSCLVAQGYTQASEIDFDETLITIINQLLFESFYLLQL